MPKIRSMRSFLKLNSIYGGSTSIGVIALLVAVFFPLLAAAQGLVPCGNDPSDPCTFCDLIQLANTVINFLFTYIVLPLMAVGILASGITILTAGGSSGQIEKGKKMLWNLGIGFLIAATAWVLINTALGNLVKTGYNFLTDPFPTCATTPPS